MKLTTNSSIARDIFVPLFDADHQREQEKHDHELWQPFLKDVKHTKTNINKKSIINIKQ